MDIESFSTRAPGRLVRVEGGHAFVPAELPATAPFLTAEIVLALSSADAELGRLDGMAANLPDPEILIGPFLRREALLSSRIEGTQTTYTELVLFEASESDRPQRDTQEVTNYIEALRYATRRIDETPLGRHLLFETHAILMRGSDERRTLPGRYRDRQVFVAPPGIGIADARYVPPPAIDVEPLMNNALAYTYADDRVPLLVRLAILHYQFEAIHPFVDGNGRMGRLLMVLLLYAQRRITAPMLYLSAYFERRRQRYYDLMLDVSRDARWEAWIAFFLDGIATQARDAINRTRELQRLRETYRQRLSGPRRSTALLTLVDALFARPVLTNRRAADILDSSEQSASENIAKLLQAQVLERIDTPGRRQYFLARDIIEIIDRSEAHAPEADAAPLETRSS